MASNKNFKGNPAMLFMGEETLEEADSPEKKPAKNNGKAETSTGREKAPEGYRLNPKYVEVKSKRVQLLVPPRVHEAVKAKAEAEGISTNEAINEALKAYIGE